VFILYDWLGPTAFAPVVLTILFLPFDYYLLKGFEKSETAIMLHKDRRVKVGVCFGVNVNVCFVCVCVLMVWNRC